MANQTTTETTMATLLAESYLEHAQARDELDRLRPIARKAVELQTKVAEQDAEIHRLRLKLAGIDRHGSR